MATLEKVNLAKSKRGEKVGLFSPETKSVWRGEYLDSVETFRAKVDKKVKEVSERKLGLREIKSNLERVRTVRDALGVDQFISKCVIDLSSEVKNCASSSKSTIISNQIRQEANEFYKRKNLSLAHRGFSLSLCYAPQNSKEMVLGYSNRSACFIEQNQFEVSLQDINRALSIIETFYSNAPDLQQVKQKLLERKERCEVKVGESKTGNEKTVQEKNDQVLKYSNLFTLKNSNSCIESAEDFVTIADDPFKGRHVKVTKDVNPGTVIILEKPYSKVLVKQLRWEIDFCHNCFKDICSISVPCVPCPDCVFAVYCTEACLKADALIHKYECKLSPYLHRLEPKRLVLLAYKTLLQIGPELKKVMESESHRNSGNDSQIYGFDSKGKYMSSSYYPINCLIYHDQSLKDAEFSQYCIESLLITELLHEKTDFFKLGVPNNEELQKLKDFATSLSLLHQMNFPCNAHSLNILPLNCSKHNISPEEIQSATTVDFGAGAFALLSMINHSCDPNVMRVTLSNGVNAVVTIHSLSAGDEVLDNYGAHYALDDFKHRQKHLMSNYNFRCECSPCAIKWPMMDNFNDDIMFRHDCVPYGRLKDNYKSVDKTGKCSKCAKTIDLKLQCTDLQEYVQQFDSAYNLVLKNEPYNSISVLSKCLTYFDTFVLPPYIKTNFAQETLKQAFNLIAAYKSQNE